MGSWLSGNAGQYRYSRGIRSFAVPNIYGDRLALEDHTIIGANIFSAVSGLWVKQSNAQPPAGLGGDPGRCDCNIRLRLWCAAGFIPPSRTFFSEQHIHCIVVCRFFAGHHHARATKHTCCPSREMKSMKEPTRLYTAFSGIFLLLQGTSTLAFRLFPSLDKAFPALLSITRMIP